ncbi:MAG TPA: RNA polymerase sigma factor [Gemmatimonadaceae bacterium]|jgi:RNA polymerase sigma-70 factor (ECF subfamily)|nr:RNA polymerase sigma factor [Gemmatimonadaceae bacterium]
MKLYRSGKHRNEGTFPVRPSPSQLAVYAVDAQLASLAAAGDDAAFTTMVTRYQPAVFRWALMFARDPDEAEDVAQEVFVRAHRQLSQYRSDGSLEAWLYAITRRAAYQMLRTRRRRSRLALSPGARPSRDVYTTDPGGRVDRERAAAVIREMFSELPPRQREIFDLIDLQGLTPAEVAERTGLKPVSVRANLFKARSTIRARFLATHPSYSELRK